MSELKKYCVLSSHLDELNIPAEKVSHDRTIIYKAADVDAQLQPVRWTKEKPTEPGWYWYRSAKWKDLGPVIVMIVLMPPTNALTILWTATNELVQDWNPIGEWAGPLATPLEPTRGEG